MLNQAHGEEAEGGTFMYEWKEKFQYSRIGFP